MARETTRRILTKKILGARKGDQVDLVLVGTETGSNLAGYEGITSYCHSKSNAQMEMPSISMLKFLDQEWASGDIIDGVIVAVQTIVEHTKHYKYKKSIFVFTDATSYNSEGLDEIKAKITEQGIAVRIIYYGDLTEENKETLLQLVDSEDDFIAGEEAYESLLEPITKKVLPVSIFRGDLALGELRMPIAIYSKTMEAKPPSAKKWSSLADQVDESERGEDFGKVNMERVYLPADQSEEAGDEPVDHDHLIHAYRFLF
jgi:hypothetical protein